MEAGTESVAMAKGMMAKNRRYLIFGLKFLRALLSPEPQIFRGPPLLTYPVCTMLGVQREAKGRAGMGGMGDYRTKLKEDPPAPPYGGGRAFCRSQKSEVELTERNACP